METEAKSKKDSKKNYHEWFKEYCAEKGLEHNMEVKQKQETKDAYTAYKDTFPEKKAKAKT